MHSVINVEIFVAEIGAKESRLGEKILVGGKCGGGEGHGRGADRSLR